MSDELNEVVTENLADDTGATFETGNEFVEASTETAPEAAPAQGGKEPLSGYEKRIATLTARNKHLQEEMEKLKTPATLAPADEAPAIPDIPDPELMYDDPQQYRELISKRDKAVADYAAWNARQALRGDREAEARNQRERDQQNQRQQIVETFVENGLKSGISEDRMAANEQVLAHYGMKPDLALFIYTDETGPQVADYLAANPEVLREINSLHPTQAAVKIATEIKPRALAKKPHVTNAPDPVQPTRGSGKPLVNELDRAAPGWTFEIS